VPADPYANQAYRQARPAVLEAAGYHCQIRAPGCTWLATTVDHVVPLAMGGTHSPQNLRAACLHCNSMGGGRITQAKRRAGRVGRRSRRW
jgi:5-methylcytosine-specific restriction endonuclease McrA